MKLLTKVKAIFNIAGKGFVMNLKAAEIKRDRIYLHPDDEDVTYMIKNSDIDILIKEGAEIPEEDFAIIHKEDLRNKGEFGYEYINKEESVDAAPRKVHIPNGLRQPSLGVPGVSPYFQKCSMTITLYGDEMERMNQAIKSSGLNRGDFIMACLQNSQKKSVSKSFCAECERVKKARREHRAEVKNFYKVG